MVPVDEGLKSLPSSAQGGSGLSGGSGGSAQPAPSKSGRSQATQRLPCTIGSLAVQRIKLPDLSPLAPEPAMTTATQGYLVRRLADAPTVNCSCGQSTRPL